MPTMEQVLFFSLCIKIIVHVSFFWISFSQDLQHLSLRSKFNLEFLEQSWTTTDCAEGFIFSQKHDEIQIIRVHIDSMCRRQFLRTRSGRIVISKDFSWILLNYYFKCSKIQKFHFWFHCCFKINHMIFIWNAPSFYVRNTLFENHLSR